MLKSLHISRLVVLVIVLFAFVAVAEANGPTNIVGNGDFSAGTAMWTQNADLFDVGVTCAPGVAGVSMLDGSGSVYQYIKVVTPPDSNLWELSARLAWRAGDPVEVYASFRDSADCLGNEIDNMSIATADGTLTEYTVGPTAIADVQCVRVLMNVTNNDGSASGCFDDISLGGALATTVGLQQFGARSQANWPAALGLAACAGLLGVVVLRRGC